MKKMTSLMFAAMLTLGLGATTLSAHNEEMKDTKKDAAASSCCDKAKKDVPAAKCGAGKCGGDMKKDVKKDAKKDM